MPIQDILDDMERVFTKCSDSVSLVYTGNKMLNENAQFSCEIEEVEIKITNDCFKLPTPLPQCTDDTDEYFVVNRVRFSKRMVEDYEKGFGYSFEELKSVIEKKSTLFGFYTKN